MKPPPVIKPNKEVKHRTIAINACMIQMIRSIIIQKRVIAVLRLTLSVIPPIVFHQLLMAHPTLRHDPHCFLERQ
jgi:hypothetical protein